MRNKEELEEFDTDGANGQDGCQGKRRETSDAPSHPSMAEIELLRQTKASVCQDKKHT